MNHPFFSNLTFQTIISEIISSKNKPQFNRAHPNNLVQNTFVPLFSSTTVFIYVAILTIYFNGVTFYFIPFFLCFRASILFWSIEIYNESNNPYIYNFKVQENFFSGFMLFIRSERIIFFRLFWRFIHFRINPTVQIGYRWPVVGISVINVWHWPLLNTALLLTSGLFANINFYRKSTQIGSIEFFKNVMYHNTNSVPFQIEYAAYLDDYAGKTEKVEEELLVDRNVAKQQTLEFRDANFFKFIRPHLYEVWIQLFNFKLSFNLISSNYKSSYFEDQIDALFDDIKIQYMKLIIPITFWIRYEINYFFRLHWFIFKTRIKLLVHIIFEWIWQYTFSNIHVQTLRKNITFFQEKINEKIRTYRVIYHNKWKADVDHAFQSMKEIYHSFQHRHPLIADMIWGVGFIIQGIIGEFLFAIYITYMFGPQFLLKKTWRRGYLVPWYVFIRIWNLLREWFDLFGNWFHDSTCRVAGWYGPVSYTRLVYTSSVRFHSTIYVAIQVPRAIVRIIIVIVYHWFSKKKNNFFFDLHSVVKHSLNMSIWLGQFFILVQIYEYINATFRINDSIYRSVFYSLTGIHGFHVFVGILFLIGVKRLERSDSSIIDCYEDIYRDCVKFSRKTRIYTKPLKFSKKAFDKTYLQSLSLLFELHTIDRAWHFIVNLLVNVVWLKGYYINYINVNNIKFIRYPNVRPTIRLWYWHFVDRIWLVVFILIYGWGNYRPVTALLERANFGNEHFQLLDLSLEHQNYAKFISILSYIVIFSPGLAGFCLSVLGTNVSIRGRFGFIIVLTLINVVLMGLFVFQLIQNPYFSCELELGTWFAFDSVASYFIFILHPLSICILFLVNCISRVVFRYSYYYLNKDPNFIRFMCYIAFFSFSISLIVATNDLIVFFLGWEAVGVCSFLLIGFWYHRKERKKAAIKAITVNRFADIFFISGIRMFIDIFGIIQFDRLNTIFYFYRTNFTNKIRLALICCAIGAIGKSAQIGFHIWLADAIEGPTPVSALLHAATIVTAGVYLLLQLSPIIACNVIIAKIIGFFGALTALFGSSVAIAQYDLKKIIAYSTCSQIGYIFAACGFGSPQRAFFHLIIHGFAKALMFLSAGIIIHNFNNEQDIRKIGGRAILIPVTHTIFCIASISIIGVPFTSGFYSKEAIIGTVARTDSPLAQVSYWLLNLALFCTTIYSFRILFFVFWSRPITSLKIFQNFPVSEGPRYTLYPMRLLRFISIRGGYYREKFFVSPGSSIFDRYLRNSPIFDSWGHYYQITKLTIITPIYFISAGIFRFILFIKFSEQIRLNRLFRSGIEFIQQAWYINFIFLNCTSVVMSFFTKSRYLSEKLILDWFFSSLSKWFVQILDYLLEDEQGFEFYFYRIFRILLIFCFIFLI